MLVYGDQIEVADPRARLQRLRKDLDAARSGPARHDALAGVLVEAGMLGQGLIDWEYERLGLDDISPLHRAVSALVLAVARGVHGSWRSGGRGVIASAQDELAALDALPLPAEVTCKVAEGYAFYAVYPESYMAAARSRPWPQPPLVIGLRSIGLSLGAAVAAALDAEAPITLRPAGHPFRREIRASDALRRRLAEHDGDYAIVDEGPGLSGSSFGAAADLLRDLGVAEERIVFMPSHRGDLGPEARPERHARWRRAQRLEGDLERLLRDDPIEHWFGDVTGEVEVAEDLSGGAWRKDLPEDSWPPAWPMQERRKVRLVAGNGVFLARFAGLGALGARKAEQAQALHAAGFSPEPVALRRGFLLEQWVEGAPLLRAPDDRAAFLRRLGAYLAFRAARFPSARGGAAPEQLREMALANAEELGGAGLRAGLEPALRDMAGLRGALRPIHVDGRLHAWEWRRDLDGKLWKTDALDHATGHDLVGPQDIAWDLAGAAVEFDLTADEQAQLRLAIEQEGVRAEPAAVAAFVLCYCAFQAGLWTFAAADPGEAGRAEMQRERYRRRLETEVARGSP